MRTLLVSALLLTQAAYAAEINRRTMFGFTWFSFLRPSTSAPAVIAQPSPALLQHRTRQLTGLITPDASSDLGPVPPAYLAEFEVMRDWQRIHPDSKPRFDELLTRFQALMAEVTRLDESSAPRPVLYDTHDKISRTWAQMRALMTEEPWLSLDWPTVYAERIAEMETRVAARLNVDVARVYQLLEHALPERDEQLGWAALIRDVARGFAAETRPIYSTESLAVLYEEAARVSDLLAHTLRNANEYPFFRSPLRAALAKTAGLPLALTGWPPEALKFKLQEYDYDKGQLGEPAAYVPVYRRTLTRLERMRLGFVALNDSPLKTTALDEIESLRSELREEVATLPARMAAVAAPENYARTPADWRGAMHALSLGEGWAATLRTSGLIEVAATLAPPEPARLEEVPACSGLLTDQPAVPLDLAPARQPVADK